MYNESYLANDFYIAKQIQRQKYLLFTHFQFVRFQTPDKLYHYCLMFYIHETI